MQLRKELRKKIKERLLNKTKAGEKNTSSLVLSKTEIDAVHDSKRTAGFIRLTYEGTYIKQKTPKVDPNLPQFKRIQTGGMDA